MGPWEVIVLVAVGPREIYHVHQVMVVLRLELVPEIDSVMGMVPLGIYHDHQVVEPLLLVSKEMVVVVVTMVLVQLEYLASQ